MIKPEDNIKEMSTYEKSQSIQYRTNKHGSQQKCWKTGAYK